MTDSSVQPQLDVADQIPLEDNPLWQEYLGWRALFEAQPPLVQRFLEAQAHTLAEAYVQRLPRMHFKLPDQVVTVAGTAGEAAQPMPILPAMRDQATGSVFDAVTRIDSRAVLRNRLTELESSHNRAMGVAAGLLRYAAAIYMVHTMLPAGRSVTYAPLDDEEIPTVPVGDEAEQESAITADTDVIVEERAAEHGRGDVVVPYVPYARRFFLPQWVAFDGDGHLLVGSVQEAEAHLASMQRFVGVLHAAVSIAAYMVADEEYQRKRYGILGQMVSQGRALARHQTLEIVATIQQRAAAQSLNRGLSISLPYFDDQALTMKTYWFRVIPAGRIMFVPAFVVRAAREEQVKVAQDTRLSPSTRKYLLEELALVEEAFVTPPSV
jgi:hypothetical protein